MSEGRHSHHRTSFLAKWQALLELVPTEPRVGRHAIDQNISVEWAKVGDDLFSCHDESQRLYHGPGHIISVLHVLETLSKPNLPGLTVQLAAFFHDAVYDPQANPTENEHASAAFATRSLTDLGVPAFDITTTTSIIEATAGHQVNDAPGCDVFLDADLSILGSPPETYNWYAGAIRKEYSHVPDADFRSGRTAILQRFLEREALFFTAAGRELFEAQARSNLAREIVQLSKPVPA